MKYEIYLDGHGDYRWRLITENGSILASGESYQSKSDCLGAVSLVRSSAAGNVIDMTYDSF